MSKFSQEIKDDLNFIESHQLQPQSYKMFKIFILAGVLAGFFLLFGFLKTVIFFTTFFLLMLLVHLVYRIKTDKFRKSWLDFIVVESDQGIKANSIGKFYYGAIIFNTLRSFVVSQLF